METALLAFFSFISCVIGAYIIFQFMDERYYRVYRNKLIYVGSFIGGTIIITVINLFMNPILNFISWIAFSAICAGVLYYDNKGKLVKRIIEAETLLILMAFIEIMGVTITSWGMGIAHVNVKSPVMEQCFYTVFSNIFLLFFYFIIIRYISNKRTAGRNYGLYITFLLILIYSMANVIVTTAAYLKNEKAISAITMGGIVFLDLYLVSYLNYSDEKRRQDEEIKMLNKQAEMKYDFYAQQEKKYNDTLKILHDVNKHIKTLSSLAESGNALYAKEYERQITDTLKPLVPEKYTDNMILNILLSDKVTQMQGKGIEYEIDVDGADFGFVDSMDITTIFGNLLDNAIEACEAVKDKKDKKIILTAETVKGMMSVAMINDCNPAKWKDNMPVSDKGERHGLGLLNVKKCIDKYDGNINMREENGKFITEFFLNS